MSTTISADSLTTNEAIPPRSRTFSPEVVAKVHALLNPVPGEDGTTPEAAKNIGVGVFEKEGAARSALTTLNKLLRELHGVTQPYASTVRQTENGYRAIILNKPAKKKPQAKADAPKPAPAKK